MRYSREHKANARARLLETTGALVKEKGFGTTGVDKLAAAAGVTSGAFYSHFGSKPQLLKAIVENEMQRTLQLFAEATPQSLQKALKFYVSETHVDNAAMGCPLPALATEVARADDDTRKTFEALILRLQEKLQSSLQDQDAAWAVITQAVGTVVIARAMPAGAARRSLLMTARANIEKILDQN